MKINIPCRASEEDDTYRNEVALIEDADFEVEEEFKVANYKLAHVKHEYADIFRTTEMANAHLICSAINWRTFRSTIFGVTWKPALVFLIFYFIFQTMYQYEVFSTCRDLSDPDTSETIEPEADAAKCNRMWHDFVASMVEQESSAIKYLTFILGFYVSQMIKRWWDQVKSLPDIDSVTNCLAGYVQLEYGDEQMTQDNALRLRKKVVRYCLLAWTMSLASISPPLKEKFSTGHKYIEKGLLRKGELKALQGEKGPEQWMTQWWIPISWAISLVNSNHPASQGCKLKEQKDIISNLNKFHTKLHVVALYQNNPLPLIYGQALFLAIHSWFILSIFSSQSLDIENSLWFIFFAFPTFQIVKIILIYGWLTTANIVRNPFGLDQNYDINLEELLDRNIWKASLSIRNLDRPIYKI